MRKEKRTCEICGEQGELVFEEYTVHGRTFNGYICKKGTGCRSEEVNEK